MYLALRSMFQILPPMTVMVGNGTGQTCRQKAESLVNAPTVASRSFSTAGELMETGAVQPAVEKGIFSTALPGAKLFEDRIRSRLYALR